VRLAHQVLSSCSRTLYWPGVSTRRPKPSS
jgi:hypothetical protein